MSSSHEARSAVALAIMLLLAGVVGAQVAPPSAASSSLPAFPGAEGFGATSRGGRGGRVIRVTNLNSEGPGSLSAALMTPGPRIIVFEVSGLIKGHHRIAKGSLTIAGQTAPGAGITIVGRLGQDYNKTADPVLQDVIIRFIRVRPTDREGGSATKDDSIQLPGTKRIIFDHVTTSWGRDETLDLYRTQDCTVQWSTIEESIWFDGFIHNCGMITSEKASRISLHHTLFAHHRSRNPCIKAGDADIRNNVIYNYRDGVTQYDGPNVSCRFNMVGNYFKQGPSDASTFPFNFLSNGQYYTRDNFISEVGVIQDPWAEAHKHYGLRYHAKRGQRVSQLFDFPAITTHDAQTAYQLVLRESGCLPHDAVTRRTMREVQEGAGFWGEGRGEKLMDGMEPVEPPTDTDRDGMPDAWETHQGLDPQRKDHRRVMPSGYTAIEEYINQLADAMIVAQREGRPTVEGQRSVWQPTGAPRPPLPPASPDELGDPELPKPAEPAKPASKPKSPPKPATKPAPAKPAEAPKPKPAEAPKSKPAEPAKPVESAKPAPPPAADKPAEAADQPAAPPRPAELPPPQGQVSAIVLPAGADDATLARQINGQTQLDALHIVQAAVTDEGMVPVRALTTLRILSLEGTPVTDLTLEIIASLPNLQALNLGGTLVTPKGLLHLRGMKSLRVLDVPADFTDPMLAQLRQAMPNVTIERGQ